MTFSLSVKPCAQQHSWSLYLNAPMFTTTVQLDSMQVDVAGEEKVKTLVDKLRRPVGLGMQASRRVEGFQENWAKVLHKGQELDGDLSWNDAGVDSDGAAITVVFKEIAAEGTHLIRTPTAVLGGCRYRCTRSHPHHPPPGTTRSSHSFSPHHIPSGIVNRRTRAHSPHPHTWPRDSSECNACICRSARVCYECTFQNDTPTRGLYTRPLFSST
jgi:hypothetical protein